MSLVAVHGVAQGVVSIPASLILENHITAADDNAAAKQSEEDSCVQIRKTQPKSKK
jgi:hypothetical protein